MVAVHVRRINWWMGSDGRADHVPDAFNGAYIACPDPIDFRAFTTIDIYKDKNAYWLDDTFKKTPRPGHRNYLGHVDAMVWEQNRLEEVLGTKTRSGRQFDIWEAVYSPVGADGYPARIFDKRTGEIDKKVAEYWRDTTTSGISFAASGTKAWARSSRASSTSTSATWTTIT